MRKVSGTRKESGGVKREGLVRTATITFAHSASGIRTQQMGA